MNKESSALSLPENIERFRKLEKLSRALDSQFKIPGTNIRFGWDSVIGLVPGAGDLATAIMAGYIVWQASKMRLSKATLFHMIANVGIDFLGGSIPLIGDIFDLAFKANVKNMELLRKKLDVD